MRIWVRTGGSGSAGSISWTLEILAIALVHFLFGMLSVRIDPEHGVLTPFWPVAGFDFAILLLRGKNRWPGIAVGALFVATAWQLRTGHFPHSFLSIPFIVAAAITRGALTALSVWMLLRLAGPNWIHHCRGIGVFVAVGGVFYPLTTMAGYLGVQLTSSLSPHFSVVLSWLVANSAGTLLVAPPLFLLGDRSPSFRPHRSIWEGLASSALFLGTALWVFHAPEQFINGYPATFFLTAATLWIAMRFGVRGVVLATAAASLMAATSFFQSKLGWAELLVGIQRAQLFLEILVVTMLTLAAAVEERQSAFAEVEAGRQRLARRVREKTTDLASSVSLLQATIESTADGLLVVDNQGKIVSFNRRFVNLWRIPAPLLAKSDDTALLSFVQDQISDPARFMSRVQYLYAHPEEESFEVVELRNGRILERISRPQKIGNQIVGRVWSFRDVTRRHQAERERDRLLKEEHRSRRAAEEAVRESRAAIRLRDDFLSIASHEMKTPLTSLKMHIQRVEQLMAQSPAGRLEMDKLGTLLEVSRRQLDRLQGLIDQNLDVTRIITGELSVHREPLDLKNLAADQVALHAEAASRAQSEITFDAPEAVCGSWDRQLLEQVLRILLSNALKFGAGHPVTVHVGAHGPIARLQVIDHGIGIEAKDRARIFAAYERAVDSRHYGGFGVGLWMARRLIEKLGGNISVESTPGQGATFTVELPCFSVEDEAAPRLH